MAHTDLAPSPLAYSGANANNGRDSDELPQRLLDTGGAVRCQRELSFCANHPDRLVRRMGAMSHRARESEQLVPAGRRLVIHALRFSLDRGELAHHASVLVLEDVAMKHER